MDIVILLRFRAILEGQGIIYIITKKNYYYCLEIEHVYDIVKIKKKKIEQNSYLYLYVILRGRK